MVFLVSPDTANPAVFSEVLQSLKALLSLASLLLLASMLLASMLLLATDKS
jgi:hypothetical protein